jgi:hypothetical protein
VGENIRIDLREKECEDVNWIQVAEDRVQYGPLLNTVINFPVP